MLKATTMLSSPSPLQRHHGDLVGCAVRRNARDLRRRAAHEKVPVSALVRRLLAAGLEQPTTIDVATIEAIARRVAREELAAAR